MIRTLAVIALSMSAAIAIADEAVPPKRMAGGPAAGSAGMGAPQRRIDGLKDPFGDEALLPRRPTPPTPVPKPAPEIARVGKESAGRWTCKGNMSRGNGSSAPLTATVTVKLDLDSAWIATTLVEKAGPLKWTEYRTYDAVAKQWTKLQMANTSGYVVSTSLGEQGGKWTWTGTQTSPLGTVQLRDYEQTEGKGIKRWGEAQLGGVWQKTYEVGCKR